MRSWLSVLITDAKSRKGNDIPIAPSLYSLSNKLDNSLLAVRDINHKYIVVGKENLFLNLLTLKMCQLVGLVFRHMMVLYHLHISLLRVEKGVALDSVNTSFCQCGKEKFLITWVMMGLEVRLMQEIY